VSAVILFPVLLVFVGVTFVLVGARTLRSARQFALRAPATVTDLRFHQTVRGESGGSWFPVVRFATADGRHIDTETMFGRTPPPARRGDAVVVLYDPADPTRATLERGGTGNLLGVIFIVLGSVLAVLGLGIGGILVLLRSSL